MARRFLGCYSSRMYSRRRWWLAIAVVVAILGALIGAEQFLIAWRQNLQPTGEAQWIWMRGASRFRGPTAFYMARDFDLEVVPAAATLTVMGDEEYILTLNGERVGSNRYATGSPYDRYRVEALLRRGTNRLVARLRSSRSEGAFLASLHSPSLHSPIVWTDGDWRVMRKRQPMVNRGAAPLEPDDDREVQRAVVIARPPEGRWGSPEMGDERPLHRELVRPRDAAPASRILLPGGGWHRRYPRVRYTRPLGPHVTFDWGVVRTGFLVLHFPRDKRSVALVYLGEEMPDPLSRPADAYVITTDNENNWGNAVPRSFRYALVVGMEDISDASLVLTQEDMPEGIAGGGAAEGVFGLQTARLRSPIENKVWSKLEGFSGDSERED